MCPLGTWVAGEWVSTVASPAPFPLYQLSFSFGKSTFPFRYSPPLPQSHRWSWRLSVIDQGWAHDPRRANQGTWSHDDSNDWPCFDHMLIFASIIPCCLTESWLRRSFSFLVVKLARDSIKPLGSMSSTSGRKSAFHRKEQIWHLKKQRKQEYSREII